MKRPPSQEYLDNHDKIFGKKKVADLADQLKEVCEEIAEVYKRREVDKPRTLSDIQRTDIKVA